MRKLKGGAVKETAKQKKERKQDFAKVRQQVPTIVLPCLAVIVVLIGLYVYFKTRPQKIMFQDWGLSTQNSLESASLDDSTLANNIVMLINSFIHSFTIKFFRNG